MEMTLYDIAAEQQHILDILEENGGELTPELEEALALTAENFENKAEGYIEAIAKYRDLQEAAAERIKKMQQTKKTAENCEKRLKERLLFAMGIFGESKKEVGIHKLSVRNNVSVGIEDESLLPECYIKTTTVTAPDKAAILTALKEGQVIPGASLETNQSLTIR